MIDQTTQTSSLRSTPMPDAMRVLLQDYPRDTWKAHPGFHEKTQHWLGAHQMFRRLGELVQRETESYLDKDISDEVFASRLSYYGDALVRNLHGHHGWEDHSYFPELSAADPRFDAGLEILERDHEELDVVLERFTRVANRSIQLIHLDPSAVHSEVGALHVEAKAINTFLKRHLSDEEDLAVPIILHHRLRG